MNRDSPANEGLIVSSIFCFVRQIAKCGFDSVTSIGCSAIAGSIQMRMAENRLGNVLLTPIINGLTVTVVIGLICLIEAATNCLILFGQEIKCGRFPLLVQSTERDFATFTPSLLSQFFG